MATEFNLYRAQLAEMDGRIRVFDGGSALADVIACRDEFHAINLHKLEQQNACLGRLHEMAGASPDPFCNWLASSIDSQSTELGTLDRRLTAIDLEANLTYGCRQMLEIADQSAEINASLTDILSCAQDELARHEQALPSSASAEQDNWNNLASRAMVERALTRWWRENYEQSRPLAIGLVEIDQFEKLAERLGTRAAGGVLQSLATAVTGITRGDDLAARSGNQRILIVFPDTPVRAAASALERVRQTIGTMQFLHDGAALSASVTCAVADAVGTQTTETLMARLEATFAEAQNFGGNRTFLHDGRFAAPVRPERFCLELKVITL